MVTQYDRPMKGEFLVRLIVSEEVVTFGHHSEDRDSVLILMSQALARLVERIYMSVETPNKCLRKTCFLAGLKLVLTPPRENLRLLCLFRESVTFPERGSATFRSTAAQNDCNKRDREVQLNVAEETANHLVVGHEG